MNTKLSAIVGQYRNILATDGIVSKNELIQMLKVDYEIPNNINYEKLADKILDDIEECTPHFVSVTKKQTNKRRMELYKNGLSDNEIAESEGVCTNTIYCWRKVRKLKANPTKKQRERQEKESNRNKLKANKKQTEQKDDFMAKRIEMYESGMSAKEIADEQCVTKRAIEAWIYRRKKNV